MATSAAMKEALWLQDLLQELNLLEQKATVYKVLLNCATIQFFMSRLSTLILSIISIEIW